jgi:uncharacterized membrane protein SirB2
MRGISWLAVKTGQLLKRDSAPWSVSNLLCACVLYSVLSAATMQYHLARYGKTITKLIRNLCQKYKEGNEMNRQKLMELQ